MMLVLANIFLIFLIYSVGGGHDRNLEVMSATLSSLKAYDQRLMFACGRLEMLKGKYPKSFNKLNNYEIYTLLVQFGNKCIVICVIKTIRWFF